MANLRQLVAALLFSLAVSSLAANTDQRIRNCLDRVTKLPGDRAALLDLASSYLQKMRETTDFTYVDKAESIVRGILAGDPQSYEALELLSAVELERHQFREAEGHARELIARKPSNFRPYATLSDSLLELGKYDDAAAVLQQLTDLRPNLTSYNRVAHYRFLTGDLDGAIALMRTAVRMGSDAPENTAWCLVELANMLAKAARPEEAADAYREALQLFPNQHSALAGLGRLAGGADNRVEAIAYYKKAQAMVPLPEYAAALHDLYLAGGDSVQAARQAALIDAIDEVGRARNENANRTLALIFADQDRNLDRAVQLARGELAVRGGVYTYDALAWALFRSGKTSEARQAMERALALGTPEPMFAVHAARILGR